MEFDVSTMEAEEQQCILDSGDSESTMILDNASANNPTIINIEILDVNMCPQRSLQILNTNMLRLLVSVKTTRDLIRKGVRNDLANVTSEFNEKFGKVSNNVTVLNNVVLELKGEIDSMKKNNDRVENTLNTVCNVVYSPRVKQGKNTAQIADIRKKTPNCGINKKNNSGRNRQFHPPLWKELLRNLVAPELESLYTINFLC